MTYGYRLAKMDNQSATSFFIEHDGKLDGSDIVTFNTVLDLETSNWPMPNGVCTHLSSTVNSNAFPKFLETDG